MGAIFDKSQRPSIGYQGRSFDSPEAAKRDADSRRLKLPEPPPLADFTDEALVKRALLQRKQSARGAGVSSTFLTGQSATGGTPPKAGGGY